MSKTPSRKLSLNRETLRTLAAERLDQVAGGWGPSFMGSLACPPPPSAACPSVEIYCGPLR